MLQDIQVTSDVAAFNRAVKPIASPWSSVMCHHETQVEKHNPRAGWRRFQMTLLRRIKQP
jgi:hypothetical protein